MVTLRAALLLVALSAAALPSSAQSVGCAFDAATLAFRGTELEQARCLLRPVKKGGELTAPLTPLPVPFETLIGTPVGIDRTKLRAYLTSRRIAQDALGGSLDAPLSHTARGADFPARYFVIHDTSLNFCVERGEFARSDEPDAPWNRVTRWQSDPNAHLYITRDGKLIAPQGRTFAIPWRATKLEKAAGVATRGRFLHIENVQLRKAELAEGETPTLPSGKCRNDRVAQLPGLSPAQLDRLALTYIAASVRGGRWLIPAYHAALDEGISDDGHDDPQAFDLGDWGTALCTHLATLDAPCAK